MRGLVNVVLVAAVVLTWAPLGAQEAATPGDSSAAATGNRGTPLVELMAAASTTGQVQVAGTIDHSSLLVVKLGGERSFSFDLQDPHGNSLRVVAPGRPPFGLGRADTVVVIGRWRDGALRAAAVLIPGTNRGLVGVMTITMIVWLGLFVYVFALDRKLRGLEER